MSAAVFEANFEKKFESIFTLADQIRQFGDIFNDYSDAISRIAELINTF